VIVSIYGDFRNPDIGRVTMSATRESDRVLVTMDGRKSVITLASPTTFVAGLRSRIDARRESRGG
jgi:hypothetical protein